VSGQLHGPTTLHLWRNSYNCPLNQKLGGLQNQSEHGGDEEAFTLAGN